MAEMAGGQGFFCQTIEELKEALQKAVQVCDKSDVDF